MTIRKRGTRYYYDFMIRRQRYRGAIPEARTKAEAEQAETKIKNKVYERKYGKISASRPFAEFVCGTYLPCANSLPQVVDIVGAPSRARTCDLLIRSQTLYPTELRVHAEDVATKRHKSKTSPQITRITQIRISDPGYPCNLWLIFICPGSVSGRTSPCRRSLVATSCL